MIILVTSLLLSVEARAQFAVVGSRGGSSSASSLWRIAAHGGLASQDFGGLWGSKFDRLTGTYYSALITRSFSGWHNGLQYVENSGNNVNPFLLSTYQTGDYKLKFTRIHYVTGFAVDGFRAYLLAGLERVNWTGLPDLGLAQKSYFQYGLLMSYDLLGSGTFRIPLTLTALRHGERTFEFANFPYDTVIAQAGFEVACGAGVSVDF